MTDSLLQFVIDLVQDTAIAVLSVAVIRLARGRR